MHDAGEAEFKGLDGRDSLFRVVWTPADATLDLSADAQAERRGGLER